MSHDPHVSVISGWGPSVFTYPSIWWWLVPILATHLGGVLGAWIYYLAIELHWTKADEVDMDTEVTEEAEPLPVKRDLEAANRGYLFSQNGGSGAPPSAPSNNDTLARGQSPASRGR